MTSKQLKMTADQWLSVPFVLLLFLFPLVSHATPINRQVGISENVFITVQNDTYGNEQRVCSIDAVTYVDGDSIPTSSPCEHCICRPPGFACTIISCEYRPGCKALKRSNQCCPEYKCECEKDGKIYQNGEKILDNNNPCEVCYCQGGDVICAVIDCFWRSDCQPRYIENRCCPLYDHCPPPADVGPTRPTRPTMPTTTPVEGTFSWFNTSSTAYEPSSPVTTTTTSTTTTTTTTTTEKIAESSPIPSSAAPVISEESSRPSVPVPAIENETVAISQVALDSENSIDQQPQSTEPESVAPVVNASSDILPSESAAVIESTIVMNLKPILLTINPTSVSQVSIVSPTESTPAPSTTTTTSATQGLEESTAEPVAEPEPGNIVADGIIAPTEALGDVVTVLLTETVSASAIIPDIEPTSVSVNEMEGQATSSSHGVSVDASAILPTEGIFQSDSVTEEPLQQDSVVQTTVGAKEEEALHVEPEITTLSPSVSQEGIVQDEEVRPVDSVSEQSVPATTEDANALQDEIKPEIPASVIVPPAKPEEVISEQEIQVNDSPANDKIEIHAFEAAAVPNQNLQPPKYDPETISHDESPVPTTEIPVEKIQDDEQNDEVASPTTESPVNDEPAVTVAQDQSVPDVDVQIQDSPVVHVPEETIRATDSPASEDLPVTSVPEDKEMADSVVTTEQPNSNIESEEKHEILADESPATSSSVVNQDVVTNSPIIFVVAPGQEEFYVSVPHNSEPVKLLDPAAQETEQTTVSSESVPLSDSAANLVDDDTFEIVPENDRAPPPVPVILSQTKEDHKSPVVEENKESVPVSAQQDEPVVTTIRSDVKVDKEEETGKDGDEDTIEVAGLDNDNNAPIQADEPSAATTLPTEVVKSENKEQIKEMEKKPIVETEEEHLSDGVVEVLSGVAESSTGAPNAIQEEHTRHADEVEHLDDEALPLADQAVQINAELSENDIVRNTESPTRDPISEIVAEKLSDDVVTTVSPKESLEDEQQFLNDEPQAFDEPQTTTATNTKSEKVVEKVENKIVKVVENEDILADENVQTTVSPQYNVPSKIEHDENQVQFDEVVTTAVPSALSPAVGQLDVVLSDQTVEIHNPAIGEEAEPLSDQAVEIHSPPTSIPIKETVSEQAVESSNHLHGEEPEILSDQAVEIHSPTLSPVHDEELKEMLSDQAVEIHNPDVEEEKSVFDERITTVQPEIELKIKDGPVMNKVQKVAAVLATAAKVSEPALHELANDQPIQSESATVRTKLNQIAGDSSESKFRLDMSIFDDSVEEEIVKKEETPILKAKTPIQENEIKTNVDESNKIDNSGIIVSQNEEIKAQDIPVIVETTPRVVAQPVDGVSNNDEILIFDEGQQTATNLPIIQSLHVEKQALPVAQVQESVQNILADDKNSINEVFDEAKQVPVAEVPESFQNVVVEKKNLINEVVEESTQTPIAELRDSAPNVLVEEKKTISGVADESEQIPTTEAYQKLSRDDIEFSDEVAEVTTLAAETLKIKATKNSQKNGVPVKSNYLSEADRTVEIIAPLADDSDNQVLADATTSRQSSEFRDSISDTVTSKIADETVTSRFSDEPVTSRFADETATSRIADEAVTSRNADEAVTSRNAEKYAVISNAEAAEEEILSDEPVRTTVASLSRSQVVGDETTVGIILHDDVKGESIQTTAANVRSQEDDEVHFDDVSASPTQKTVAAERKQNLDDFVEVPTTQNSRFAAEYHDDVEVTTGLPNISNRNQVRQDVGVSDAESATTETILNDGVVSKLSIETTLAPAEERHGEIVADESASTINSNQILADEPVDTTIDPVISANHDDTQTSEEIATTTSSMKNESIVKTSSDNTQRNIGENVEIPRISEDMRSDIGSLVSELSLKSRMTHEVSQVEEPWLWRTYNRIRNLDFFPRLSRQPRDAGDESKKEKTTYPKTKKATQELPKEIKKQVKLPSRSFLLW